MPSGRVIDRNSTFEYDISEQTQNRNMRSKRRKIVNNTDIEKLTAPTFNIHIHVPPCSSRISKFYLPRIQPVIHLHFDEILNRLKINEKQLSDEVIKRTFKNLLDATSPRFGDVKFHFDNKLEESDIQENEISNMTPESSKCQSDDTLLYENEGLEKIQEGITGSLESVTNISNIHESNSENNKGHMMPASYWLDKDLKLRKAVVVLTDVSKDKNYKDLMTAAKANNSHITLRNKDDFLNDVQKTDQGQQINKTVIKQENESNTSEFFDENESENKTDVCHNNFLDTGNNVSTKELYNVKLNDKKTLSRNSSLTALAEGCNFSEILSKFRVKYNQNLSDSLKISDSTTANKTNVKINNPEERIEDKKISDEMDYKNITYSNDVICVDFSKNELDVIENRCYLNGNELSDKVLNVSHLSCHDYFKTINLNYSKPNLLEQNIKQEFNFSTGDNTATILDSDEYETTGTTSKKGLVLKENVTHLEVIEPNSPSLLYKALVNKLDAAGMNKTMPVSDKKYTEKSVSIKKEYEAELTESSSSLPKKMKHSEEEAKKSGNTIMKPSSAKDYIALNEAGPTEFAIAPLDEIKPYKRHPAENFKNEMLYGNRVQRFSSSHDLKTYKAKNACRKSFNV